MDQLANHLGMSKRTIYEVFSDKDALLEGVLQLMVDRQKLVVQKILDESENVIVAIFKLVEISWSHFQDMSPAFQADIKKFHSDFLMNKSEKSEMPDYRNNIRFIQKGIDDNLFRKDINADLVNRCLYALGKLTMDNELFPFELFSRKEVLRNVYINYLRGISTPEGIELINVLEINI